MGGALAGAFLVVGALVAIGAPAAGALTTIAVTTNADAGAGSLRQALLDGSSGGSAQADDVEMVVQAGLGTISLASTLTYDGGAGGAHSLIVDGSTLTMGNAGAAGRGGAILATGRVTVANSTLTENRGGLGGAIRTENGETVSVTNSTFANNASTNGSGGAIFANGG